MDSFLADLRFSVRMLARNPAFTVFTIATLGVGLGLNTALFSVINGVLLRPLPYANPRDLVDIQSKSEPEKFPVSLPNFNDWQAQSKSFAAIAVYSTADINLTGQGDAERVAAVVASNAFFDVLGVRAARGRTWGARDSDADGVVISAALWRRRFAAEPTAIGRSIVVNGASRTIIGVMPANFSFASGDIWLRMPPAPQARRGNFNRTRWPG